MLPPTIDATGRGVDVLVTDDVKLLTVLYVEHAELSSGDLV